jgi:hypothetical protein
MHVYDDCSAVHASIGEEKADIIELRHQSGTWGDVTPGYACNQCMFKYSSIRILYQQKHTKEKTNPAAPAMWLDMYLQKVRKCPLVWKNLITFQLHISISYIIQVLNYNCTVCRNAWHFIQIDLNLLWLIRHFNAQAFSWWVSINMK